VRGLVVDRRGVDLFRAGLQVLDEGNTKDLLEDVGNFPQGLLGHDNRHRFGLLAETGAGCQGAAVIGLRHDRLSSCRPPIPAQ